MKRLTIGADACTETLALLISMAWADGHLDENEKAGVLAAAEVFNLTKELRDRVDQILQKPMPVEELLVEGLSSRDKSFAFVAAAWMSGVDAEVDEKERQLLDKAADLLGVSAARKTELLQIARDLEPLRESAKADGNWTNEIVALFKAIPARLEGEGDFEVAFE